MSLSVFHRIVSRWPQTFYAASWTLLLSTIVAVASFSAEFAFVSAVSPSSTFSRPCSDNGSFVRLPLDVLGQILCLPDYMVRRNSPFDIFVPTVFAALVVAGSSCVVRALGWWDAQTIPL